MVVFLVIDGTAGVVQFALNMMTLADRKLAAGKTVSIFLIADSRVTSIQVVLLTPGELSALYPLMNALLLLVQAVVDTVRVRVHRRLCRYG